MSRVLIAYATRFRQTERIARRIAEALRKQGHAITLIDEPGMLESRLGTHDAVIVGASVQYGHHDRALERAVHDNARRLARFPNAFFSVSMSAARPGEGVRRAQLCVEQFVARNHWEPRLSATFGGALAYTRYPTWMRWMMRWISSSQHGDVDTSRDHEYTDWAAVERFATQFAAMLPPVRRGEVRAAALG